MIRCLVLIWRIVSSSKRIPANFFLKNWKKNHFRISLYMCSAQKVKLTKSNYRFSSLIYPRSPYPFPIYRVGFPVIKKFWPKWHSFSGIYSFTIFDSFLEAIYQNFAEKWKFDSTWKMIKFQLHFAAELDQYSIERDDDDLTFPIWHFSLLPKEKWIPRAIATRE